jgi:hypothetical protein
MCTRDQAHANMTIVPYSAVADAPTLQEILETKRVNMAWFRGSCNNGAFPADGKLLRSFFANDIANSEYATDPAVIVQCRLWDKNNNSKGLNHTGTLREMLASNFCLSIAGDTLSSRRISEIIVTGCIPVFVGPPWHTLPLPNYIPWDRIALFFEIRDPSRWTYAGKNGTAPWDVFKRKAIDFDWLTLPPNAVKYTVDEP